MKKYSIFPFTAGKVYFATMSSDPNFQIDITTQEGIVFLIVMFILVTWFTIQLNIS